MKRGSPRVLRDVSRFLRGPGCRYGGYMLGTSGSSPNGCNRFGVKNARAEEICGQKKRGSGQKRRGSGQKVHFGGQKAKFAGKKKLHHGGCGPARQAAPGRERSERVSTMAAVPGSTMAAAPGRL